MELNVFLIAAIVLLGFAVGLMSAMFGVGGGVIMVPFMVLVLEQSQHVAEGTSLLVVVPTAIAGVIAHHKRGYVSFRTATPIALAGIFGAFAGAILALEIDPESLKTAFGIFTILTALRILFDGVKTRRGEQVGS